MRQQLARLPTQGPAHQDQREPGPHLTRSTNSCTLIITRVCTGGTVCAGEGDDSYEYCYDETSYDCPPSDDPTDECSDPCACYGVGCNEDGGSGCRGCEPPAGYVKAYSDDLPPCAQKILDSFLSLSNDPFAAIIYQLADPSTIINLTIKTADIPNKPSGARVQGQTIISSNPQEIIIQLNNAFLNSSDGGTDLAVAATLAHEAAHAYIDYWYKMQGRANSNSTLGEALTDYAATQEMLGGGPQHEIIGDLVDKMAITLQQYYNSTHSSLLDIEYFKLLC